MADLAYCTAADVEQLAGEMMIELRGDDLSPEEFDAFMAQAIDYASGRIDFYCGKYSPTELAGNRWVKGVAVLVALRKWCGRRGNAVPEPVELEWEERQKELELIRVGEAKVPNAAYSRRPVAVTNYHVDQRRANNNIRVDRSRSTGVAKDYRRPIDPTAPDQR